MNAGLHPGLGKAAAYFFAEPEMKYAHIHRSRHLWPVRFRVATTDSSHPLPIAPNLLNRNFTVTRPNTT